MAPRWHENICPCPDDRDPDAAKRSIMSAGIGSLDEQDDAGSQHGAASAEDLLGTIKVLRETTG